MTRFIGKNQYKICQCKELNLKSDNNNSNDNNNNNNNKNKNNNNELSTIDFGCLPQVDGGEIGH